MKLPFGSHEPSDELPATNRSAFQFGARRMCDLAIVLLSKHADFRLVIRQRECHSEAGRNRRIGSARPISPRVVARLLRREGGP
jgi:hypothetical protein